MTTRTFVVRLWIEAATAARETSEVRGEVRDAVTDEVRYFRKLDGLLESIRALVEQRDVQPF